MAISVTYREWREFEHLVELPLLEDLVFIVNPLEEEASVNGRTRRTPSFTCASVFSVIFNLGNYLQQVSRRLVQLKKLDGNPIIRDEEEEAEELDAEALTLAMFEGNQEEKQGKSDP